MIEHNKNDFDNLFNLIKDYPNLIVVMESTSIYHLPVENYFRSKAFDTVVCNPKLVKQFKDTLNKSKTDKLDCFKIARCYLNPIKLTFNPPYLSINLISFVFLILKLISSSQSIEIISLIIFSNSLISKGKPFIIVSIS